MFICSVFAGKDALYRSQFNYARQTIIVNSYLLLLYFCQSLGI
jgi:hypothetical protein